MGRGQLDATDRRLLTVLQRGVPIVSRPYAVIGEELGLTDEEVLSRVRGLRQRGVIRRLGGVFATKRLGFESTLAAARVPDERLEEVAAMISSYRGVTHNYERRAEFNLWFTFIAEDEGAVARGLEEIRQKAGLGREDLLNLPTEWMYKIGVKLNLEEADNGEVD